MTTSLSASCGHVHAPLVSGDGRGGSYRRAVRIGPCAVVPAPRARQPLPSSSCSVLVHDAVRRATQRRRSTPMRPRRRGRPRRPRRPSTAPPTATTTAATTTDDARRVRRSTAAPTSRDRVPSPPATRAAHRTSRLTTGDCTDSVALHVRRRRAPTHRATGSSTQPGRSPRTVPASRSRSPAARSSSVRFEPAYGYDFDSRRATPTPGPTASRSTGAHSSCRRSCRPATSKAVLTWVIGLDEQRPFTVTTTGTASHVPSRSRCADPHLIAVTFSGSRG